MTKNKTKKIREDLEKLLNTLKKPTKLNCIATDKCQINFEQIEP